MRRSIVKLPTTGLILLLLWNLALGAGRDPEKFFFEDSFGDFQAELAEARAAGKKGIMIFFEADDCPFCHRMKRSILNQPDVQAYFRRHFRLFAVDIDGDLPVKDFSGKEMSQKDFAFKEYRVRATPVVLFFDLEGNKIARYTGAVGSKEEFLLLGRFVAEGHYRKMRFTRFKRQHRGQ